MKRFQLNRIRAEIEGAGKQTSVYIGCDSKVLKDYIIFGVVVAIHDRRKGGASCYAKKIKIYRKMMMTERLLKETEFAIEYTSKLETILIDRDFEIHLDINPHPRHKSHQVFNSAVGWVESLGWNYKVKPYSHAAHAANNFIN